MGEIENENNSLQVIAKEYLEELGAGVNTDLSLFETDKSGYMISWRLLQKIKFMQIFILQQGSW